jgi:hypothetical protein
MTTALRGEQVREPACVLEKSWANSNLTIDRLEREEYIQNIKATT